MKANFINILRKVTGTSIQKDISSNIVSTNQYSLTPEIIPKKERGKNNPAYYPVKDIGACILKCTVINVYNRTCLLYTSDAADEL